MAKSDELIAHRDELLTTVNHNAARLREMTAQRGEMAIKGGRSFATLLSDIRDLTDRNAAIGEGIALLDAQITAAQADEADEGKAAARAEIAKLDERTAALSAEMIQTLAGHGERSHQEIMHDAYAVESERVRIAQAAGVDYRHQRNVLNEPAWSQSDPHGRRARMPYSVARAQGI